MQLSVMRTEARLILNEPDIDNSHFSESQLTAWANECYRYAVTRLGGLPIKERDYSSATGEITLNASTLTVDSVYLNAQPGNKLVPLSIIDLDTLAVIDPAWASASAGIPAYLVRKSTFVVILYPPPDTSNIGQTLRTYGLEFPTALSADTDTPLLPANLHDIFPHYVAYRGFQQLNLVDRATAELIFVNGQLKAQASISLRFSNQRNRWLWHELDD